MDINTIYEELRPLGASERYSTTRSDLGIYLNVCVTARFCRRTQEAFLPRLRQALAHLVLKHPVLSAVPVDTRNRCCRFVRLASIDLDRVITIHSGTGDESSDIDLDTVLEGQHNQPFLHDAANELSPFWRLVVFEELSDITLIFCFHHSVADTKSAIVFLEDLETALSSPPGDGVASSVSAPSVVPTPADKPLPPTLESVYSLPLSEAFLARQQHSTEPGKHIWSGQPQSLPVKTRFSSFRLSPADSATFRAQCKARGVSVTAAMMALLAAAFFRVLPEEYSAIQGDCAVSLRRLLAPQVTERDMGCWVGAFSQAYQRSSSSESSVWDDARRTKDTIAQVISSRGEDMGVGYLRHVSDMHAWFLKKMGMRRAAAWELSNVGNLDPPTAVDRPRDYEMQGLVFSQSASACSGAVKVSVITGRDGCLAFGFTWQEGIIDDGTVRDVMDTLRKLLFDIEAAV